MDEDIPTNEGTAQRHQGFVNIIAPIRSQSELPRPMEPRDRPLHHPTVAPQSTAMARAAPRDSGSNAAATQATPMRIGVVGPIGVERVRARSRTARLAPDRRDRVHQGFQLADIGGVGSGQSRRQGNASAIGDQVVLAPGSGPIGGVRPRLLTAAEGSHRTAVNYRPRPIDLIGRIQLGQQQLMQGLPDSGLRANRAIAASRSCRCRSPARRAGLPSGCRS